MMSCEHCVAEQKSNAGIYHVFSHELFLKLSYFQKCMRAET